MFWLRCVGAGLCGVGWMLAYLNGPIWLRGLLVVLIGVWLWGFADKFDGIA